MLKYLLVPEDEVDPATVAMARDVVRRGLAELEIGAEPEIRWFADARELPAERVASATEVFVPGDGEPKAGNVPPFVRYAPETGWTPKRPVILLNRSQCLPDTPLHELRHLWQIREGRYRADETSSRQLEDDADAWAAGAVARIGATIRS